MQYVVTKLVTEEGRSEFSLLGVFAEKNAAAKTAVKAYQAYRSGTSAQNVAMITEWLEARGNYSFRRDGSHRLQLAITPLEGEEMPAEKQVIFSAAAEEEELSRRISQALFEGQHSAERRETPVSCVLTQDDNK